MQGPRYPALYQLNTRVFLTALSQSLGRAATLDDIADAELDRLSGMGFDWLWLLSVWQTGEAAQRISRSHPGWRREFEHTLPDLREEDIAGSGFAIKDYRVHRNLGGDAALARLRARMRQRGLRLMLDFVPNHMALDHPWTDEHPDHFVHASEDDLARAPEVRTVNIRREESKRREIQIVKGVEEVCLNFQIRSLAKKRRYASSLAETQVYRKVSWTTERIATDAGK